MYKSLYHKGYLAYAVMLVLALVFYKERTVFLDISYHLFYILKEGSFIFQGGDRYGAVVTQVFPVVASWLSLPLSTVMLFYSLGYIVYYTLCYWICGSVLKNYRLALVLMFCNILFVSDTFYWMQSEMPQGIAFMAVAFAYLERFKPGKQKIGQLLLLAFLASGICFYHPLLMFPTIFVLAFFLINTDLNVDRRIIFYFALIVVLTYTLKKLLLSNPYEDSNTKRMENFLHLFPHYFDLASNKAFLKSCINKFYWIPVSLIIIISVYSIKRKWRQLSLFVLTFLGYLLLINVSYPEGTSPAFYVENLYLPLSIFLAFPLIYDVLPLVKDTRIAVLLLVVVIVTGATRIFLTHDIYTKRLNWERAILDKHIDDKLFIYNKPEYGNTLLMNWGTSFEFWLLSTSEYGRTASIIIPDNPGNLYLETWEPKSFITNWGAYPYSDFKPPYFIFKDTVNHYKVIK